MSELLPKAPPSAQPGRPPLRSIQAGPGEKDLTPLRFRGVTKVASTAAQVDEAVAAVYARRCSVVGFDIEWRVSFQGGAPPLPVALMQLAVPGGVTGPPTVFLLHLAHSGMTSQLASFLADATVAKAGVCVANDGHKVARDFGVSVNGQCDVSDLAQTRLLPRQRWSLAALTARLLSLSLPKPGSLRTGAWDARALSHEQQQYAALDAWASLRVHATLAALPELALPEVAALAEGPFAGHPAEPSAAPTSPLVVVLEPRLAQCTPLQPAKLAVIEHHCRGMTAAAIAAVRNIKEQTVESYLGEAIAAGHPYCWNLLGVAEATAAEVDAADALEDALAAEQKDLPTEDAETALRTRLKGIRGRVPHLKFTTIRFVLAHRARVAQHLRETRVE